MIRMRKGYILLGIVAILFLGMMDNAEGQYVENVRSPDEVELGETFTVSFEAISYLASGEAYVNIGLCDESKKPVRWDDGYQIAVNSFKDEFYLSTTPLTRNVKCNIEDVDPGTYYLRIVMYDKANDESYDGWSAYTGPIKVIEEDTSTTIVMGVCCSLVVIVGLVIGVIVYVQKKSKKKQVVAPPPQQQYFTPPEASQVDIYGQGNNYQYPPNP